MNVTLEGTRNLFVDGASNFEVLPAKWRNFRGEKRINPKNNKVINDEGVRNFTLSLDANVAQALADIGVSVKILPARSEEEEDLRTVKVKVKTDGKMPPQLYFVNGNKITEIPVSQYNILDMSVFEKVDLVINLYHPEEDKTTLYLNKGYFTLKEDPISAKYKNYITNSEVLSAEVSDDQDSEETLPWD